MAYTSPKHQKGAAAILFVVLLPALFAVFIWGVEGARMLQSSARLTDASEVASLAVTAEDGTSYEARAATAQKFVEEYFPLATVSIPTATRTTCQSANCEGAENQSGLSQLVEYEIGISLNEDSWFPNASTIANFGSDYTVSSSITARKGKPEPIDVVLVASYSATMNNTLGATGKTKASQMNSIIESIATELKDFNDASGLESELAVVGFNHYVELLNQDGVFSHNLICTNNANSNNTKTCAKDTGSSNGNSKKNSTTLDDMFNSDTVHATKTIDNIFTSTGTASDTGSSSNNNGNNGNNGNGKGHGYTNNPWYQLYRWLYYLAFGKYPEVNTQTRSDYKSWHRGSHGRGKDKSRKHSKSSTDESSSDPSIYATLALSSDMEGTMELVKDSSWFKASSSASPTGSASYTGIIEGARAAVKGQNTRRLMIILTDGVEAAPSVATELYNAGLCTTIKNHMGTLKSHNGDAVEFEMAVVRLANTSELTNFSTTSVLSKCVGQDHIFDYSAINGKILNLISEEVGYLVQ